MTDAHIYRRASMWLLALVVGSALSAAAQPPTLEKVDQTVKQQQAVLDQLNSTVVQLKAETGALRKTLDEINRKPAPVEAWKALGAVGLFFVAMWGAVALAREWSRMIDTRVESAEKMRAEINQQVQLIEAATTARITALTALLSEARTQPQPAGAAKGWAAFYEHFRELVARPGTGRSKGAVR